jgi:hypothetical protein
MPKPVLLSSNLAPDYYLNNFQFLVDWVLAHYDDLLSDDEKNFIARFSQLDRQSQCLFVRLSSRKGPLFRADKLHYAEIDSIEQAANQLIANDLLRANSSLDLNDAASLLTKVELLAFFNKPLAAFKQERKDELVKRLEEYYSESQTWECWTNNQLDRVYRLETQTIVKTLLVLFFGNDHQDLTEFVLQDLGLLRYENYTIDHQHRIFKSRAELAQYQSLNDLHKNIEEAATLEQLLQIAEKLPIDCISYAMEHRQARLCNRLAYEFERLDEHARALNMYEYSQLPPARERRIRLLEKKGNFSEAWKGLTDILSNAHNEHELQIAERMAPRLAKKVGESFNKKIRLPLAEEHLCLERLGNDSGEHYCVEEIVQLHLHSPEAPCIYAENQLLNGLFGLWLWPEIFRGVNGAFANPFQMAPLDMYHQDFVANRPQITARWKILDDGSYTTQLRKIWKEKNGIANHFVNWEFLDKNTLNLALNCIPAGDLKVIFERLLFDVKANRSGLPDLIQFYPGQKNYCMIEVKGPGDRIQDNQQRWLDFFNAKKIPAKVVYVDWQ